MYKDTRRHIPYYSSHSSPSETQTLGILRKKNRTLSSVIDLRPSNRQSPASNVSERNKVLSFRAFHCLYSVAVNIRHAFTALEPKITRREDPLKRWKRHVLRLTVGTTLLNVATLERQRSRWDCHTEESNLLSNYSARSNIITTIKTWFCKRWIQQEIRPI